MNSFGLKNAYDDRMKHENPPPPPPPPPCRRHGSRGDDGGFHGDAHTLGLGDGGDLLPGGRALQSVHSLHVYQSLNLSSDKKRLDEELLVELLNTGKHSNSIDWR